MIAEYVAPAPAFKKKEDGSLHKTPAPTPKEKTKGMDKNLFNEYESV